MKVRQDFRFSPEATAHLAENAKILGISKTEVLEGLILSVNLEEERNYVSTIEQPAAKKPALSEDGPAVATVYEPKRQKLHLPDLRLAKVSGFKPVSNLGAPRVPYGSLLKGKK